MFQLRYILSLIENRINRINIFQIVPCMLPGRWSHLRSHIVSGAASGHRWPFPFVLLADPPPDRGTAGILPTVSTR